MTQTGEFERHNLEVDREMDVGRNCRTIEVYFETWFDVAKKFNFPPEVNDEDGTWVVTCATNCAVSSLQVLNCPMTGLRESFTVLQIGHLSGPQKRRHKYTMLKDTTIPYRIASTGEQPISYEYWFTKEFTGKYQTINGLLRSFLKGHSINPAYVLEQLWFQWQEQWCKCDYEVRDGLIVDYYLLKFNQN